MNQTDSIAIDNLNDAPNEPAAGFTTIRFGPGTYGNAGQLDIYCDLPRSGYFLCILGMYDPPFHLFTFRPSKIPRALLTFSQTSCLCEHEALSLNPFSLSYVACGSLSTARILNSKQTCFKDSNCGKCQMGEVESELNRKLSASEMSDAVSNSPSLPARCSLDIQTARHELPTLAATPELESLSRRVELCSPVSPIEEEIRASVVNRSQGSCGSNPPAYMLASDSESAKYTP